MKPNLLCLQIYGTEEAFRKRTTQPRQLTLWTVLILKGIVLQADFVHIDLVFFVAFKHTL